MTVEVNIIDSVDAVRVLVRLLGQLHALWVPMREPDRPYWAAVWELRRHYRRKGLPWRAGGQKAAERLLTALADAGLVRPVCVGRRTVATILTPEGMTAAGKLIGVGPMAAVSFAATLERFRPMGQWVPEVLLNDGRGWGDGHHQELAAIEDVALPALAAGYVEANCARGGQVAYRVLPAGAEAVLAWDGSEADDPVADQEAVAAYDSAMAVGLGWLRSLPRLPREIGKLPLSPLEVAGIVEMPLIDS